MHMKIICTADTHMYHRDFKTIPTGDMFIHAGDFLRSGNFDELKEFSDWINSLNFKYKIVVAGNHDGCLQRDRLQSEEILGKEIIYLQDNAVCINGIKIYGSSWQPRFYNFSFNLVMDINRFGHNHQRGGLWTMENKFLVNATSWEGERDFSIFEFDTIKKIVKAIQIPPSGRRIC